MGLADKAADFNSGQSQDLEAAKVQAPQPAGAIKPPAAMVATDSGINAMFFDHVKFNQAWRVAQLFADTALVPKHFQKQPSSVFIALNLSNRLGVDPLMLMQNLYVVHGTPGYYAKFVIAMVNERGPFTGPIQWKMTGKGDDRECVAYATHKKTGERCKAKVTWEMVVKEGWTSNPKWHSMPEMMFQYRSATFLTRLYCPEVIMGFSTVDELEDMSPEPNILTATMDPDPDRDVPTFDDPMPDPPDAEKMSEPVNGEIVDNDPLGLDEPHPNQAGHDRLVERIGAMGASDDQIRTWSRLSGINTGNPETMINANLDKLWALHMEAKQAAEQADASAPAQTGTGWSLPELLADMAALEIPTDWQANWMTETGIMQGDKRTHSQPRLEQLAVLIEDYRKNA